MNGWGRNEMNMSHGLWVQNDELDDRFLSERAWKNEIAQLREELKRMQDEYEQRLTKFKEEFSEEFTKEFADRVMKQRAYLVEEGHEGPSFQMV